MRLDDAYRLLEVEPDASDDAIHEAYRDLTKVWHPDRFAHDASMRQKADERLKRINEAYQTIRDAREGSGPRSHGPRPHAGGDRDRPPEWRVRTEAGEFTVPDLQTLVAHVVRGRISDRAEIHDPTLGKWIPLLEVPELRRALGHGRAVRRRGWALACSVLASLILLRRPTPGGLIIAVALFGIAAVLILRTRHDEE